MLWSLFQKFCELLHLTLVAFYFFCSMGLLSFIKECSRGLAAPNCCCSFVHKGSPTLVVLAPVVDPKSRARLLNDEAIFRKRFPISIKLIQIFQDFCFELFRPHPSWFVLLRRTLIIGLAVKRRDFYPRGRRPMVDVSLARPGSGNTE